MPGCVASFGRERTWKSIRHREGHWLCVSLTRDTGGVAMGYTQPVTTEQYVMVGSQSVIFCESAQWHSIHSGLLSLHHTQLLTGTERGLAWPNQITTPEEVSFTILWGYCLILSNIISSLLPVAQYLIWYAYRIEMFYFENIGNNFPTGLKIILCDFPMTQTNIGNFSKCE